MAARPGTLLERDPGGPGGRRGTQLLLGILPFLLMAVVATVDALAGPGVGFLPLLSLGPALAAVSLRPAQTGLVGVLGIALCAVLASFDNLDGSRREVIALVSIAGVTGAGILASAGRQRRERQLADVSAVAEAAQRVLLHPAPRNAGPFQIAVRYISANTAARIGGDLYELVVTGEKVRLIVGDVQGKGLPAVHTAAVVLGAFREAAFDAPDLPALAARIELSLQRQATEEEFVTAVLAELDASGPVIRILNCGHPPPLLLNGTGAVFAEPAEPGLPLGLAQLATASRDVDVVALPPSGRMLFYTDGISESRDKAGTFYDLGSCGALLNGLDPEAALQRLCSDVTRHVGHQLLDDAAVLLVGRPPAAAAPAIAAADLLTGQQLVNGLAERCRPGQPYPADDTAGVDQHVCRDAGDP